MNNKNYEDAANYLVIYGMVVTGMSEYDSLYLEETLQFYEDYESEISLEAQSNLAHYLGTIYHRIADIEKSSYWHEKCVEPEPDRKSTRLNSSHVAISYAVVCLKKKK